MSCQIFLGNSPWLPNLQEVALNYQKGISPLLQQVSEPSYHEPSAPQLNISPSQRRLAITRSVPHSTPSLSIPAEACYHELSAPQLCSPQARLGEANQFNLWPAKTTTGALLVEANLTDTPQPTTSQQPSNSVALWALRKQLEEGRWWWCR